MRRSFSSQSLIRNLGVSVSGFGCNARARPLHALTTRCLSSSARTQRPIFVSVRPRLATCSSMPGLTQNACGCACGSRNRKKTAYIALGSNLGDRVAEIERACNELDRRGIRVKRTSSLWETEPMYVKDQNRFVNGACEVCKVRILIS